LLVSAVAAWSESVKLCCVKGALFQPFPMPPERRAQAWRHRPAFQRPRHFHEEPELNLVTAGTASFAIGDERLTLGRGDVLMFHPGQDHVLLSASDDLGLFAVALRPELAARAFGHLVHVASRGCRLSEAEVASAEAILSSAEMGRTAHDVEPLLVALFRDVRDRSASTHVLSRLALKHVNADPGASGAQLGGALRAHPSALSRHFHGDLGIRFVEYRARVRLIAFVRLVDQGHALNRAALDAGFGSYAQCHRVFRGALGCSPRDYFNGQRQAVDDARFPQPAPER
jgi:AraC-like DNA-binding protein/mannose-6-phosphate isomerase-like protein (cupin superfamily)